MKYVHFSSLSELQKLGELSYFKCLVVIELPVDEVTQWEVSKWLVNAGCRHMLAWGLNCSSWDDSVDMANIESTGFEEFEDDNLVITTWHENESLADVIEFAKHTANHPVHALDMVVLDITANSREKDFEAMFKAA